jgi:hypothetical protein
MRLLAVEWACSDLWYKQHLVRDAAEAAKGWDYVDFMNLREGHTGSLGVAANKGR